MIRFLQKEGLAQKWMLTGFLLLVCVSMVWYLVPQGNGGSSTQAGVLATVGDHPITVTDLQQIAAQMSRMYGGRPIPPQLYGRLIEGLISDQAQIYEANKLGLRVSDAELRDELQHGAYGQYLFPNGKYIGDDQYTQFVESNFSMPVDRFEQQQRGYLLETKLQSLVSSDVSVSPEEIQKEFVKENVKVKLQYAVLTPASVMKQINPTETELRAYFNSHQAFYANSIPEKRKAKYVAIDLASVANQVQVSDQDLVSYYNSHREDFNRPEQVEASHILIKTPPPGPDGKVDPKADAAAKAKAEDILKQLKAGANFAQLAKKDSQDTASAINGGSLGWFQHGAMVPEFDKVAFSLPVGQISDLVKTQFGYHIIRVDGKRAAGVPPLSEVKDQIEPLLKQQLAAKKAQTIADAVEAGARASTLDAAAAKEGLQVVNSDWFARTDTLPGIGSSQDFMTAAFQTQPNTAPQEIGTQQGYVIFQVTGVQPAATPTFEAVRSRVEEQFKQERAEQIVAQKTQELADRAHSLHDLAKAAKEVNADVKTSDFLDENGQAPDLGNMQGEAGAAFAMKTGEISGPLNINGNGVVLMVTDRQEPQMAEMAKSQDKIRDKLLATKRRDAQDVYVAGLVKRLEAEKVIKKNDQQIAAATRTSAL